MPVTIRGQTGELRRGYRVAAELGRWELTSKHRCEAVLVKADAFEWTQDGPLSLRLALGVKTWIYPDVTLLRRESPLVIKMAGSPEIR